MTIKALYPTVRPALDLNFAQTKRLDPLITYTRASTGTFYDGKTFAKSEENLLIGSDNAAASGWTASNGIPGTLGPELITNGEFDSGSNWSLSSASIASGQLTLNSVEAARAEQQVTGLVPRGIYKAIIDVASNTGSYRFETNAAGVFNFGFSFSSAPGITIFYFTAPTNQVSINQNFRLIRQTGSQVFNSISIQRVTSSNATAPDGTATASLATAEAANATFLQSRSVNAGDHTFSVWLRRVTGSGNVDITAHDGGTFVTQSGVIAGSGWTRYAVTQTLAAGGRNPGIRLTTSGDQVEIWGTQFEERSAVTAYTPTYSSPIVRYVPALQTAAINQPRFEHNPVTQQSLGLEIEEARSNQLTFSQILNVAGPWTLTSCTIDSVATIAPNGTLTGNKLIVSSDVSSTTHRTQSGFALTGMVSFSVFLKAAEKTAATVRIAGAALFYTATINLTNGTISSENFSNVQNRAISVNNVGNGWYRVAITGQTSTANAISVCSIEDVSTGDGYSGFFAWGAQVEGGGYATSYIPTAGAGGTRNEDFFSITGDNFASWYNQSASTFVVEMTRGAFNESAQSPILGLDGNNHYADNVSELRFDYRTTGTSALVGHDVNAVLLFNVTLSAFPAIFNSPVKTSYSVDLTSYGAATGLGGEPNIGSGVYAIASLPVVNRLTLNRATSSRKAVLYSRITYWPYKLSNLELTSLTRF